MFGIVVITNMIFILIGEELFFRGIIHLFECIALFLTTYVYFQEGKFFLPYITLIAGIGFLFPTLLQLKEHKKIRSKNET